jgi:hypothetical protein
MIVVSIVWNAPARTDRSGASAVVNGAAKR